MSLTILFVNGENKIIHMEIKGAITRFLQKALKYLTLLYRHLDPQLL
jgi:hypothetical protein